MKTALKVVVSDVAMGYPPEAISDVCKKSNLSKQHDWFTPRPDEFVRLTLNQAANTYVIYPLPVMEARLGSFTQNLSTPRRVHGMD